MEDKNKVKVKTKNLPQSALKLRLVADMVRGMKADEALEMLDFENEGQRATLVAYKGQ